VPKAPFILQSCWFSSLLLLVRITSISIVGKSASPVKELQSNAALGKGEKTFSSPVNSLPQLRSYMGVSVILVAVIESSMVPAYPDLAYINLGKK
jgi:hypothetical protein